MRPVLFLTPVLAALAVVLSGCGYAGEPKPPALRLPMKAADLTAVERGSKIFVTFQLPQETTEGLPITASPDVELRIGAPPTPWNPDTWGASADRIPVPAWEPVHKEVSKPAKRGAAAPSGRVARKALKTQAAAVAAATRTWYSRTIEIDATKYTNKSVVIGVRVHGPNGRSEGWSVVSLGVLPILPVPGNIQAGQSQGVVHLEWTAAAPGFRIFRKLPAETDWVSIGESTQPSFDDKTFEYGKTWQYYVQSVQKTGEGVLESDRSETFSITPADRFPPAVPGALAAISGTRAIELVWDAVTDGDLAGYRVYRNGAKIADRVLTTTYSDKDVATGTKYSYQVSAVDQTGNESLKSAAFEITME